MAHLWSKVPRRPIVSHASFFSLVFALETNTKIKMHVKCQNVRIAGLRGVVGASKRGPTAQTTNTKKTGVRPGLACGLSKQPVNFLYIFPSEAFKNIRCLSSSPSIGLGCPASNSSTESVD